MAKVYCIDCKFFDTGERIPYSFGPPEFLLDRCLADENFKDTNVEPSVQPLSQPNIINRFNNCKWYVSKQDGSSSSSSSDPDPVDHNIWAWRLITLTESATGTDSVYDLPLRPMNVNYILPFINGVQTSVFTYNSDDNSIEFTEGPVPETYKVTVYMMVRIAQVTPIGD